VVAITLYLVISYAELNLKFMGMKGRNKITLEIWISELLVAWLILQSRVYIIQSEIG
jgi:hypothetical protein